MNIIEFLKQLIQYLKKIEKNEQQIEELGKRISVLENDERSVRSNW